MRPRMNYVRISDGKLVLLTYDLIQSVYGLLFEVIYKKPHEVPLRSSLPMITECGYFPHVDHHKETIKIIINNPRAYENYLNEKKHLYNLLKVFEFKRVINIKNYTTELSIQCPFNQKQNILQNV